MDKKLNILQVNKMYYPVTGGIERVVQQLAEGLKEEVNMKVLVCQKKGKGCTETINGVPVTKAGSFGMFYSMPVSFSFLWLFRKMSKKVDIIHFHMPFPLGDLACLLSGYQGKVVLWWHSDIVKQKKLMRLYRPLMEWLLQRADMIIVATQGHIDFSSYLKPYEKKCKVIPFGVEKEIAKRTEQYLVEEPNGQLRFLFVGRLVYYKGCKYLIKAFSEMVQGTLIIVGEGPLENELREQAQKLNIKDRVIFLKGLTDEQLAEQFAMCDVFVLPSVEKSEAFGLVQIEAMAYGKPVINTNLKSGVPYVSVNGKTGITVEPKDSAALASAMDWMIQHPEEREKMGKQSKELVRTIYTTEFMLQSVRKSYAEVINCQKI